ncbi:hypothetical protein Tco_0743434 [Tanacetum coccineum]
MIRLRVEATFTSHSLPLPLPFILSYTRPAAPSSGILPLHLLFTNCREDIPEVTLPPRKRLGIALGHAYDVGESSFAAAARPARGLRADYGFIATIDREIKHDPEREVRYEITNSWDEIVETLDRRAHAHTRFLMETEAKMSREAWVGSIGASDLARAEVMSLHTTVLAQQSEIRELQSVDRRRQMVISEILTADYKRQRQLTEALKLVKSLQTQMAEL